MGQNQLWHKRHYFWDQFDLSFFPTLYLSSLIYPAFTFLIMFRHLRPDTTVQNILFCFNIILTFCWLISKLIAYKC